MKIVIDKESSTAYIYINKAPSETLKTFFEDRAKIGNKTN
jgi:hypothetical protein